MKFAKIFMRFELTIGKRGGLDKKEMLMLHAKDPIDTFEKEKKEWISRLEKWKKECLSLRNIYPGLTYFTINEARHVIVNMDQILLSNYECRDDLAFKYVLPYFQRLDYSLQNISPIIDEWTKQSEEKEESLQFLGKLFSKTWSNSKNNETAPDCFAKVDTLCREHVLICKETTTEEEVECLLLRTFLCTKEDKTQNARTPLYCLVWPEKLAMTTVTKVTVLLRRMLLSQSELRQMHPYLFVVISSNQENEVAITLQQFKRTFNANETSLNVEDILYIEQWKSFLTEKVDRKPFVQLYTSKNVGMGKTWKIKHDIKSKKLERIYMRFNSSIIDWDFIVNTFWQYLPCQFNNISKTASQQDETKERTKDDLVVYHLDISSCVGKEINDFLFQLFFHVNPNMAFFIEIPSKFDSLQGTAADILYTLFPKPRFPTIDVNKDNNPFQFGREAQYCIINGLKNSKLTT
ncbi:hypothetical protein RFI_06441 [Reticulomyxa filosa]|uniref:Uncharacterized protein n=1 Tax=Reticulomyxa filosa TaxID=46433 RepID=X6NZG9_RETFI|nr:hypothetical protein RFI_06441 [Reticulomyxa filosa]|eukprot:ETO30682.1 hypothetical protein RFI_06441 [Reticulomyxa filosa]